MFMFKANLFLDELLKYCPSVHKHCKESLDQSTHDLDFIRINENIFNKSPNISVDIAVMEKTKVGTVLPLNIAWSDVGSWKSLWNLRIKILLKMS